MNDRELAFEYALGTLRGQARKDAEQRLREDPEFANAVAFWEQHMMAMQKPAALPTAASTWARIAAKIDQTVEVPRQTLRELLLLRWALALSLLFAVGLSSYSLFWRAPPTAPNASYAAVLLNQKGSASLTALTSADSKQLWLQWETVTVKPNRSLQLWAVSKRDGEARSVAIFSGTVQTGVALDEATARLIHDAAELLLTEEETGGSALDQPSEQLIARGVCVQLKRV
ncbi:hypothetical protein HPT27_02970 [Permianibacter sp. IMCC34836]|uniref:anti-sigma factor n=1 Tax=Permianibacter fluminis TaxID=2738515 RepID=UPI00155184EA|nr:anti-sigma factor [Permianibacter fluminis]NQD35969.1 hypothetical protein [Permianibacter fluminis]